MKPVRILVDSTVDLPERCRAQVRAVPETKSLLMALPSTAGAFMSG